MALMAQLTGQAPPNGTQADGNDPMAQMMAALNGNGAGGPSMFPPQQAQGPIRPPTLLQRCLPLLHIIAMLALSGWIYVTADMDWSVLVQGTQAGDPSRDAQSWSVERLSLPRVVSLHDLCLEAMF